MSSVTKNLFKKDSFSDPKMLWTGIEEDSKLYLQISEVLKKSYPNIYHKKLTLKVSGIGKLNSSNVLIKNKKYEYVMKIFPSKKIHSANYLEMINNKLKNNFYNVPLLEENSTGRGYTKHKSSIFLLYEKVGNRHYLGEKGEFESFFEIFKNFSKNYPADKYNYFKQPLLSKNAEERLKKFISLKWKSNPLEKYQKIVQINSDFLSKKIKFVQEKLLLYNFNNLRPLHIDLHPHNIAVSGNSMYFLDLEAIHLTSLSRSLGFAFYKLIRQSVANGLDIKHFHNFFKSTSFLDFLEEFNLTKDELKIAASQEVLRRIFILIDLLEKGDSDWVFVLPMHLNGLKEIDIIFET
tara:strand:- start:114 stop:1163 length:1050 start_codon:yes stop_codon:yes gene_type:complete